ncbi:hypothetical protein EJ06DRAFT_585784 [Trichodelitschia bisporula]|uniref:Snf7-domain-containing protein n=1 Tax=Trichodelitschia bisporula TaxID=703511 RepID=A0A6G1HIG8_9PEZI|nr:hypothetical protein EJ06DRAFT_585784 [Trichodelitschia bisporula]
MSSLLDFLRAHEPAFQSKSRLASLYSDFRHQSATNPDGYAANIATWHRALSAATRAGLLPDDNGASSPFVLSTGPGLARALETRECGRPLALDAVIADALAKKTLLPVPEFLSSKTSIYARGWVPSPWDVLSWAVRAAGLGSGPSVTGRFVVLENLEAALAGLQAQLKNAGEEVHSLATFAREHGGLLGEGVLLSNADLHILLTYLSRDKPVLSYDATAGVVKLAPAHTTPVPITEADVSVANLRTLQADLSAQISPLEDRLTALDARARELVAQKANTAALAALRSKKMVDSALAKRRAALHQVEDVLGQIEAARDNVALVKAMRESAAVIKGLNAEVGGVEGVERVVDALREQTEVVEDVTRLVGEVGAEGVDAGDVEEEFEALEREEREKVEAEERRVRNEKEQKEAAERARRLANLENYEEEQRAKAEAEKQTAEVEKPQGKENASPAEKELEEMASSLGALNL